MYYNASAKLVQQPWTGTIWLCLPMRLSTDDMILIWIMFGIILQLLKIVFNQIAKHKYS